MTSIAPASIGANTVLLSIHTIVCAVIVLICVFANISLGYGQTDLSPFVPVALLLFGLLHLNLYTATIGVAMVGILLFIVFGDTQAGSPLRILFSIAQALMAIEVGKSINWDRMRVIIPAALAIIILGMVAQRLGTDFSSLMSRGEEVAGRGAPGFFSEPSLTAIASTGLYFIGSYVYSFDTRMKNLILVLALGALALTSTASSLVFILLIIAGQFTFKVWRAIITAAILVIGLPLVVSFSPRLQVILDTGILNDASFLARITPYLYAVEGLFLKGWQIDALVTRNASGDVRSAMVGLGAIFYHFKIVGLIGTILFLLKYLTPSTGLARNAAMLAMMVFSPISFPMVWLLTGVNYRDMLAHKEIK